MIKEKSQKQKSGAFQVVDVKKINLNKNPEDSESSLQFLILLLKASFGMNLEQILGLFTNQNKYLAHIIVKGIKDSFDPVILFYSLLNKHSQKLKSFHEQDNRDAEACLYAIKPGFISRDQRVAELALELFGKLNNIYEWFVSEESKCAGTFLLGIKRHPALRDEYWQLLLQIVEGEPLDFFTRYYSGSFQNPTEQIEITTYLLRFISKSEFGEKLVTIGIASNWLETAATLPESDLESQLIVFDFIGELMERMPSVIEQNEESLAMLNKGWQKRKLGQFAVLLNQLIVVLEKLGESKSPMARRIYTVISQVAKSIGPGDKRDYLVQNFIPLISKFPTIPSEHLILQLKGGQLSYAEYLLICESIEISQDQDTLISIGNFLKMIFMENPLVNFYVLNLLKQVVEKVIEDEKIGHDFISSLLEESLHNYAVSEIKYKIKPKQQHQMYFGISGTPEKKSKEEEQQMLIKEKWKEMHFTLLQQLTDIAFSQQNNQAKSIIKQQILKANSYLKLHNHKIGSKKLEEILIKKFEVPKKEQNEYADEYKQKVEAGMQESSLIRKSKVHSQATSIIHKLKGPENLTKSLQTMVEKRKQEEEQKKQQQAKKQMLQEKKKQSVKKQLQIVNLLRGQIGQAQIREEGFLEKLIHEQKQITLVQMDQLQNRDVEAIEAVLKKYHRVLRHLFLQYTSTMYSNYTPEAIEDNIRRKEILTAVELGKMLKDYRMFYMTSQPEINSMVRDINVKLLDRRDVNQLDFKAFQQYIIQFCNIKMILPHEITVSAPEGNFQRIIKTLSGQPLHVLLKEFFMQLKQSFLFRREKVLIFQDIEDIPLTKEQQYEIGVFNQKLNTNHNYILPKGYKKIVEKTVEFQYRFSTDIRGVPEQFEVAFSALDYIFNKALDSHVLESIAEKKVKCKVRPSTLGALDELPRERSMSTVIDRKTALLMDLTKQRSSKGTAGLNSYFKQKFQKSEEEEEKAKNSKEKQAVKPPRRAISLAKLAELDKARLEAMARRAQEKQEKRERELQKQKEEQRKKRAQYQKFIEDQRARFSDRKKNDLQEHLKQQKEEQERELQKKQMKEKFKILQQNQIDKIKQISLENAEKIRREREDEEEQRQRMEEQKRRLRQKIKEEDEKIVEIRKEIEHKLTNLFESQGIKYTFQKYQPNLKALFDFLIQRTHLSLTQKKHNNEIIFDTWRYFLTAFELSPLIVQAKDIVFVFKSITRDKIVPKQYLVGLSYTQFQESLLRLAIKYKTIFNLISQKIKDKIEEKPSVATETGKLKKSPKKINKQLKSPKQEFSSKAQNQFQSATEINIKDILKQNNEGKDGIDEYGDLSKVTQKTLRGLIYYLKVPNQKVAQEERFRSILSEKPRAISNNAQRLKQKLNEQYSLQVIPKKPIVSKGAQNNGQNLPIAENPKK